MDEKELLRFDPNFPELMDALLACGHWYTFRDAEAGAYIVNEAPESALVCAECDGLRQLDIDLQAKGYEVAP